MVALPRVFAVDDGPLMSRGSDPAQRAEEAAGRYFEDAVDDVRNAAPGTRNNTLSARAYAVGRLVGGGYIGEQEARVALEAAARFIAMPAAEAGATITRALGRGMAKPRDLVGERGRGHQGRATSKPRLAPAPAKPLAPIKPPGPPVTVPHPDDAPALWAMSVVVDTALDRRGALYLERRVLSTDTPAVRYQPYWKSLIFPYRLPNGAIQGGNGFR